MTKLGDIIKLEDTSREPLSSRERLSRKGRYPYYGAQGIVDYLDDFTYEGSYLLVAEDGDNLRSRKAPIANAAEGRFRVNNHAHVIAESQGCNLVFLRHLLNLTDISAYVTGSTQPKLSQANLLSMELPIPPIKDQNTIADILGALDKKIGINDKINGYLAMLCEGIAAEAFNKLDGTLNDICIQVTDKTSFDNADKETYVSTESLLQNKGGRQMASSLPTTGKVTCYRRGDTLVSNIRPYFKKVWFASNNGTCSGDVLVFRANEADNAAYLYSCLRQDRFFDHVMRGVKGTKMPRGDKKQLMGFPVASRCDENNLDVLNSVVEQMEANDVESACLAELRDALLPKLMSGEIDVSKVNATQLNSHLSGH